MARALVRLGVSDMAAHLYVIYWGLASFYTPPTCIAVYVTCGISGSKVWETGWEAVKLGIAAFLVPVAFVLNPGLLLMGGLPQILLATTTAFVGAVLLAGGIRGYALGLINGWQRTLFRSKIASVGAPLRASLTICSSDRANVTRPPSC